MDYIEQTEADPEAGAEVGATPDRIQEVMGRQAPSLGREVHGFARY